MVGSALNTVEGFPILTEVDDKAIELLKNRFANPKILIEAHMNKILTIKPLKTIKFFRKLVDKCTIVTTSNGKITTYSFFSHKHLSYSNRTNISNSLCHKHNMESYTVCIAECPCL